MFQPGIRAIYQKDINTAIVQARRLGFSVLEIHASAPQFWPQNYSLKQCQAIKRFAQNNGITLQTHAPLEQSLIFTDPALRAGAKKQLLGLISFSRKIGARCLTLHPGKAPVFYTVENEKIKNDELFPAYYAKLFDQSLKQLISMAPKDLYVCVENTDNFNQTCQKVLAANLRSQKIFLTCDLRKLFNYDNNILRPDQQAFFKQYRQYVKNLHVSGLTGGHGRIGDDRDKIIKTLNFFSGSDLPLIFEILPVTVAASEKKFLLS
jgi:sugar phosphate isomerase/epimerase